MSSGNIDDLELEQRADDISPLLSMPKHHDVRYREPGKVPQSPKLILLKPNGVPVFSSIETKSSSTLVNHSTLEQTAQEQGPSQTVRSHSFVVGKKVSNQTAINLLSVESAPTQGAHPVKVIYVKPSAAKPASQPPPKYQAPSGTSKDEQRPRSIKVKQPPAKEIVTVEKEDIKEPEKKAVLKKALRPRSAQLPSEPAKKPLAPKPVPPPPVEETSKPCVEIPFAENRLKGQFGNLTKDLFKKAQEAVQEKKAEEARKKEEEALKKERLRLIEEQIKRDNQEKVQRQKERGAEHVDFRKKEEEAKEKARQDENKAERAKQRELREKRKQEGRKNLGLDMIEPEILDEHRMKVKQVLNDPQPRKIGLVKGAIISKPSQQRPKSSNPALVMNQDLNSIFQKAGQVQKAVVSDAQEALREQIETKHRREQILKEQKRKRREKLLQEQLEEELSIKKKEDNLKKLRDELQKQKQENLQRLAMAAQLKEAKGQDKLGQKRGSAAGHQEQLVDLQHWIEEQMLRAERKEASHDEDSPPRIKQIKISDKQELPKANQAPQPNKSLCLSSEKDISKVNIDCGSFNLDEASERDESHILPGNSEMGYQESLKYGSRFNRYGIFGDNEYQQAIEISKRPEAKIVKKSQSPVRLSKEGIQSLMQQISEFNRVREQPSESASPLQAVPELTVSSQRKILNQIHKQYLLNFAETEEQPVSSVPGVVNIENELQRQKQEEAKARTSAVLVIQKWSRGFLARRKAKLIRQRRERDIELEYGYFEDRVKFNQDYNLQKFLKDKERLREKNKTRSAHVQLQESESIMEKIGESSSSLNQRVPVLSKVAGSQSMSRSKQSVKPVKVQNYVQHSAPDYDPNSIINLYIRAAIPQHAKPAAVQSPIKTRPVPQQAKDAKKEKKPSQKQQTHKRKRSDSIEEIEEDIVLSDGARPREVESNISHDSESIAEEILSGEEKSAPAISSESQSKETEQRPFQSLRDHKPFSSRQFSSSIVESIQEDLVVSNENRKGKHTSFDRSGSIVEESHLINASASKASSTKKPSSVIEESIASGGSVVQNSNSSTSQQPSIKHGGLRMTEMEIEREKTLKQIRDFEEQKQANKEKNSKLISDLLSEMNKYEQASVSQLVVERMEKFITQSLARKDSLLIGQRLNELEMEKRHKEEIARIREDQMKMMMHLLLQGGQGGVSEKERKEMLDNLQKMIDKPIQQIGEKRQTVNSSSQSQSIKESIGLSNKEESKIVKEEDGSDIDENIDIEGSNPTSEEIPESIPEEESHISQVRKIIGSEKEIRQQSKKAIDPSSKKEQVSGPFSKNSYTDFTEKLFKDFLSEGIILTQVERQIEQIKEKAMSELDSDLKSKAITPRSYRKKGEELEKWAELRKKDLQLQVAPLTLQYKAIVDNLQKEKDIIVEKIGVSPRTSHNRHARKESSSLDEEQLEASESNESGTVKMVRDQISKLQNHDIVIDPLEASESAQFDLKIKKQKALAKKLVEEKEKIIEAGLKQRLRDIEAEKAKKMMDIALKIDTNKEIDKRYKETKKAIEESGDTVLSARSISQSGAPSESVNKRKVQFASPQKQGRPSEEERSRYSNSKSNVEESIDESISINESVPSMHQSVPAALSQSKQSYSSKFESSAIKESLNESQASQDDYSEDFESNRLGSSRNKTPKKQLSSYKGTNTERSDMIDEEYSQRFDESQPGKNLLVSQDNEKSSSHKTQPDPVTEFIDNDDEKEAVVSSKNAQSDESVKEVPIDTVSIVESQINQPDPLAQSSEDHEVQVSSKSVEWLINLATRSGPPPDSYSEDFVQSYESQVDKEPAPEDDIEALAEQFTEEYFKILLEDLQENSDLVLGRVPEEKDFLDKFPFNLEKIKEEVKQASKPAPVISPPKNVKSPYDIQKEKYEEELKKVQENQKAQIEYLEMLIENIDRAELREALEKPIDVDPLKKLVQIFPQEDEGSHAGNDTVNNNSILLGLEFFVDMEDQFKKRYQESSSEATAKFDQYHHKAIYDALNQALDQERPYKDRGQPTPWSKQTRVMQRMITDKQLEQILMKARNRVASWCTTGAGTRLAPVPTQPPTSDENNQTPPPILQPEDDRRNGLREIRLGLLMVRELEDNEQKWVDYEDEDTQVKFDLADMVLDVLASEVSDFLYRKQRA